MRSYVGRIEEADWDHLNGLITGMRAEGDALLDNEGIPQAKRQYVLRLDCRYAKQYHEVTMEAPLEDVAAGDGEAIKTLFHGEHNRLYGYSLEDVGTPVENHQHPRPVHRHHRQAGV